MLATVLFGAAIVFVAISTIYDDIRTGLIRNRRVLQGLAAGAGAYAAVLAVHYLYGSLPFEQPPSGEAAGDLSWLLLSLLNALAGFIVGVVLWLFKVWAAGDAKLFLVYCFLIPPDVYRAADVPVFPGIILLVNIFTFTFLYLVGDGIAGAAAKARAFVGAGGRGAVKAWIRQVPRVLWTWAPLILAFTAMFAGIRAMRETAREGLSSIVKMSEFTLFMVLFVAFKPLSEIVKKRTGAILFSILSLAAIVFLAWRHGAGSLLHLVRPGASAILLIVFARAYQKVGNVTRVTSVGQLRPGMILAQESQAALLSIEKKEREEAGARGEAPRDDEEEGEEPGVEPVPRTLGTVTVDGLSAEQIRFIKTRFKDDEKILVAQTLPFSPILALGALSTFFLGRALVTMLMHAFR
jgi:hypothetical protein